MTRRRSRLLTSEQRRADSAVLAIQVHLRLPASYEPAPDYSRQIPIRVEGIHLRIASFAVSRNSLTNRIIICSASGSPKTGMKIAACISAGKEALANKVILTLGVSLALSLKESRSSRMRSQINLYR